MRIERFQQNIRIVLTIVLNVNEHQIKTSANNMQTFRLQLGQNLNEKRDLRVATKNERNKKYSPFFFRSPKYLDQGCSFSTVID